MVMNSCYYTGEVRHRRFTPKSNSFTYQLMMFYLDLDEVEQLFTRQWWKPFSFQRQDYFDQGNQPLKSTVRDYVLSYHPQKSIDKVYLLTQLRCFGYVVNPISCYYCFDAEKQLQALVLEVTNTPWGEKQLYVLDCHPDQKMQRIRFNKAMHVSPFNPMEMIYQWSNNLPDKNLHVHLSCWMGEEKQLDATMRLETDASKMISQTKNPLRYVYMTYKVVSLIYWQALKLLVIKRVPFYSHPKYNASKTAAEND